jgi:hypothetical protein
MAAEIVAGVEPETPHRGRSLIWGDRLQLAGHIHAGDLLDVEHGSVMVGEAGLYLLTLRSDCGAMRWRGVREMRQGPTGATQLREDGAWLDVGVDSGIRVEGRVLRVFNSVQAGEGRGVHVQGAALRRVPAALASAGASA